MTDYCWKPRARIVAFLVILVVRKIFSFLENIVATDCIKVNQILDSSASLAFDVKVFLRRYA
jgi:hypothetical protein